MKYALWVIVGGVGLMALAVVVVRWLDERALDREGRETLERLENGEDGE